MGDFDRGLREMYENQISSHNNFKDGDLSTKLFGNNTKVTGNIPNQEQLSERGLISDVEYNLEDVIRKLENLENGLNKLYGRIFEVHVVDGDPEKLMSKPNPVYSPNSRIKDNFLIVDNLLNSIDKIVGNLDKSL